MPNKNFVIIVPDSNGDRSVIVLNLEADSHSALDEHTVRRACDQGIQNYLDAEDPGEREDHIKDELRTQGYTVKEVLTSYTTIETRE